MADEQMDTISPQTRARWASEETLFVRVNEDGSTVDPAEQELHDWRREVLRDALARGKDELG